MSDTIDLGDGIVGTWHSWRPDRTLNPHLAHLPDIDRAGLSIAHTRADGTPCEGFVTLDGPVTREVFPTHQRWEVRSMDPLTLSPSVLCSCGWHGWVTDGRWRTC